MDNLEKVINETNNKLDKYGFADVYIHPYSITPLNFEQKCKLFDGLRLKGYNIWPKTNSHGVKYYRIS